MMATEFVYRAANSAGDVLEGKVTSQSRASALEDLRRQNLFPIQIEEGARGRDHTVGRGSNRREAVRLWTRSMATLLGSGVTLERSLAFTVAQARNPDLTDALTAVRADVHAGVSLTTAMRKHARLFGNLHIALVAAGEETGALGAVMQRLADHMDEESELRGKIRTAMTYPAVMAIVTTVGLLVMVVFVIPRLADMLKDAGGTLPVSARLLIGGSSFAVTWWPLIAGVAAISMWEFRRWNRVPDNRRKWHARRLRLPVVGEIERELAAARFTRTLALLLSNGTGILAALRIARDGVPNEHLSAQIEKAAMGVSGGRKLSAELSGILPADALELIRVGEETGQLGKLSLRAAETYEADLGRRLRMLIGLIEPAFIVIFGGIVGFVAIAMLQAIYSINGRLS